jgi:hypothetical protein
MLTGTSAFESRFPLSKKFPALLLCRDFFLVAQVVESAFGRQVGKHTGLKILWQQTLKYDSFNIKLIEPRWWNLPSADRLVDTSRLMRDGWQRRSGFLKKSYLN